MKIATLSLCLLSFLCVQTAAAEEPVRIGATLALTGSLSIPGEAEQRGLLLGADYVNAHGGVGGRKLEILFEDNLGDPKQALNGVMKMLDTDKVSAIFSARTHITQAVKHLAVSRKTVLLYASSVSSIAAESPFLFKDLFDAAEAGELMGQAAAKRNFRKVFFLTEESDACTELERGYQGAANALRIVTVARESFISGETDLKPLLLRAKERAPEAIITCTWRDTLTLMKGLQELALLRIPTIQFAAPLLPVTDTQEMRALYEENRTITIWYGFVGSGNEAQGKNFIQEHMKRFGEKPRPEAAYTYDDAIVLAQAMSGCLSGAAVDQECFAAALAKTDYQGIAGRLRFNESRCSNRGLSLIEVKEGQWSPVH